MQLFDERRFLTLGGSNVVSDRDRNGGCGGTYKEFICSKNILPGDPF
jgi:hypothetical protein